MADHIVICHTCEGQPVPAADWLRHLHIEHGILMQVTVAPATLEQQIEEIERKARLLYPPWRWWYLGRVRRLRREVVRQRDKEIESFLIPR